MKEADIQTAIVLALEKAGHYVVRVPGMYRAGVPDLAVCVAPEGLYLGLEVKQPGEVPTPIQRVEARRVMRAGGWATVARSPEDALKAVEQVRHRASQAHQPVVTRGTRESPRRRPAPARLAPQPSR